MGKHDPRYVPHVTVLFDGLNRFVLNNNQPGVRVRIVPRPEAFRKWDMTLEIARYSSTSNTAVAEPLDWEVIDTWGPLKSLQAALVESAGRMMYVRQPYGASF